jgi:hypothetical protein
MFVAVGTSAVAVGGMYVPVGVGTYSGAVAVALAVAVDVGVADGTSAVAVAVAVDVGVDVGSSMQTGPNMVLESSVTAPVCARARPFSVAPVCRAMLL